MIVWIFLESDCEAPSTMKAFSTFADMKTELVKRLTEDNHKYQFEIPYSYLRFCYKKYLQNAEKLEETDMANDQPMYFEYYSVWKMNVQQLGGKI